MQTMNISLPDLLKKFVDKQVASGRYSSVSDYIRDLIRDDNSARLRRSSNPFSWKASKAVSQPK